MSIVVLNVGTGMNGGKHMTTFDWKAPHYKAFKMWRKYVHAAKEGGIFQELNSCVAMLHHMHYVTGAAIEKCKYRQKDGKP